MNWLPGETLGQTVEYTAHGRQHTVIDCWCVQTAHCRPIIPVIMFGSLGRLRGTRGIIEMFLWLADVSVCGNSEVQLSPVVSQHRRIALLSVKLTVVFTYCSHQPPPPTTRDNSIQISPPGRFCENISLSALQAASDSEWDSKSLSLSHYQILGSNVIPATHIWARLECWGLSLLIVFAGGIWLEYVWRVAVVVVVWCQHKPVMRIWKLL